MISSAARYLGRLLTKLEITGDYYNFSNIRYGQAPTGPQRFRAPLEPTSNETYKIIDNGSVGRICPQASGNWSIISSAFTSSYIAGTSASFDYDAAMAALPETPPAISSSDTRTMEDCLFLDVIVPSSALAVNATQLPVLIWVSVTSHLCHSDYHDCAVHHKHLLIASDRYTEAAFLLARRQALVNSTLQASFAKPTTVSFL